MKYSKKTKNLVPETAIEHINRIQSRFNVNDKNQDSATIRYVEFCAIKDEILNPENRIEILKKQFRAERADMIAQFMETQKICEKAFLESVLDLRNKIRLLQNAVE